MALYLCLNILYIYAMAHDGYFFSTVSEIHPSFQVPAKSIILQGIIALVMVFSGTFDQILTYMGFSLGIFPLLSVAGIFKLRFNKMSG